jgi:hypothetical protein
MKVYTKVVVDISSGSVIESLGCDYTGPVAQAGGKPKAPKAEYSPAGKIVGDLYGKGGGGPLGGALRNILANPGDDPFTQRQLDVLTQRTRGGYGARGLAGSGIAAQGEQDVMRDFLLNRGEQKQGQAIQILGTGGTAPQFGTPQQPRGFLGMK